MLFGVPIAFLVNVFVIPIYNKVTGHEPPEKPKWVWPTPVPTSIPTPFPSVDAAMAWEDGREVGYEEGYEDGANSLEDGFYPDDDYYGPQDLP